MMQMLLMAGIAASQSTTTAISTTTAVSTTGVQNTTTPIQITQPITLAPNKTYCGFFWGNGYSEAGMKCEFFMAMDIGWAVCFGLCWLGVLLYFAVWASKAEECCGLAVGPPNSRWGVVFVVELFLTLVWPLAVLVPALFLLWRWAYPDEECVLCCGSEDTPPAASGSNAGASNGVTNASGTQTTPPLVTRPATEAPGAQFNQRFPKISPGDCRPKYSRVQTSAC
jgi:hypothetical protein